MKKFALIFVIGMSSLAVNAQTHAIFDVPENATPATVTRLNLDPQFPALRNLATAEQVYNQLKALGQNPTYSSELNSLFRAIGYTGIDDPDFASGDVESASLPYGAIGLMGNGDNTYKYSILMLPGQNTIPAWTVDAKNDGPDMYFLAACGNSFHYENPERVSVVERETVIRDFSGKGKAKVRVVARNRDAAECGWCKRCDDDVTTVLLSEDEIEDIPVSVDGTAEVPVRTVYIDVDRKTMRRLQNGDNVDIDIDDDDVDVDVGTAGWNTLEDVASR